jgi:hypothetical protein
VLNRHIRPRARESFQLDVSQDMAVERRRARRSSRFQLSVSSAASYFHLSFLFPFSPSCLSLSVLLLLLGTPSPSLRSLLRLLYLATMRKQLDSRIPALIGNGVANNHRSFFVLVGDRGRDQVVNLHFLLSQTRVTARPSVLWCYKKDLGFTRFVFVRCCCLAVSVVSVLESLHILAKLI